MLKTLRTTVLSCAFVFVHISLGNAQLYKCTDPKGQITFSDKPCPGSEKKVDPKQSTPPTSQPHQPKTEQQKRDEVCAMFGKVAFDTATARDKGTPLSTILRIFEDAYKNTADDVRNLFRKIVINVYDNRHWQAPRAQQEVETQCQVSMSKTR